MQIHQHRIRILGLHELDPLETVARRAHELEALVELEIRAEQFGDALVVVDEDDP
ncbi:MAG TPA: hypothetical protein VE261_02785 [Gaiellaceae bacterium]|nr:hypothetical protein [Gaiellaceae bacterium]